MKAKLAYFFFIVLIIYGCNSSDNKLAPTIMSNKNVVETYMDGFRTSDHARVLSCLTEDVIWEMPGFFHKQGKKEFDGEIENENFVGSPEINIIRMVEEGNIVIAEGEVTGKMKNGGKLDAVFCDVFHFEKNKIKKLTSYLMNKQRP